AGTPNDASTSSTPGVTSGNGPLSKLSVSRTVGSGGETEDLPERSIRSRAPRSSVPAPGEPGDGPLPEGERADVHLEDAHLPSAGKRAEHRVGRRPSDAAPPPAAEDEELGHVGHVRVAGELRSAVDQSESSRPTARPDQERNPSRIAPVGGDLGEAEAAVLADLARHELAEVVDVELEQVREKGLLGCA